MKKRNRVYLPEDLIEEILSRVPTVSVARLRSTSKGWNALVKDGRFAKKHFAYAPRHSEVIMLIDFRVYLLRLDLRGIHDNVVPSVKVAAQFSLIDPLYDSSEEVDIRNVLHCDGLLLCSTLDNRLVVWNPCSGETMWIQPRKSYKKSNCYAFGKSESNKYKILKMHRTDDDIEYEIYDLASNSWRVVGVTWDWSISRYLSRGITMNGNTYWLEDYDKLLLSFDFSIERFRSYPLPGEDLDHRPYSAVDLSVTREEQQLCILATRGSETDVWIANKIDQSTGVMSWTKFLKMLGTDLRYHLRFGIRMSFLVDQGNKVVLSCNGQGSTNNIIHILGENKYINVDHLVAENTHTCLTLVLHSYVPSLVQIQQGI